MPSGGKNGVSIRAGMVKKTSRNKKAGAVTGSFA
jgi:hypothetical protein